MHLQQIKALLLGIDEAILEKKAKVERVKNQKKFAETWKYLPNYYLLHKKKPF